MAVSTQHMTEVHTVAMPALWWHCQAGLWLQLAVCLCFRTGQLLNSRQANAHKARPATPLPYYLAVTKLLMQQSGLDGISVSSEAVDAVMDGLLQSSPPQGKACASLRAILDRLVYHPPSMAKPDLRCLPDSTGELVGDGACCAGGCVYASLLCTLAALVGCDDC